MDDSGMYEPVNVQSNGKNKKKAKQIQENVAALRKDNEELKRIDKDLRKHFEEMKLELELKRDLLEMSDRKHSKLFDENKQLKLELSSLEQDKEIAEARLKALGCHLRCDKTVLEARAEVIKDKWETLFQREWMAAREEFSCSEFKNKHKASSEERLVDILKWCYDRCSKLAEEQGRKILTSLKEISDSLNFDEQSQNGNNDHIADLMKHIQIYRNEISTIEKVTKICKEEYLAITNDLLKMEEKFLLKCPEICWLMRLADPPMVLKFNIHEDNPRHQYIFTVEHFSTIKGETLIKPALIHHENGSLVSPGIIYTNGDSGSHRSDKNYLTMKPISPQKAGVGNHSHGFSADQTLGPVGETVGHPINNRKDYLTMKLGTEYDQPPNTSHKDINKNPLDPKGESNHKVLSHPESPPKPTPRVYKKIESDVSHGGTAFLFGQSHPTPSPRLNKKNPFDLNTTNQDQPFSHLETHPQPSPRLLRKNPFDCIEMSQDTHPKLSPRGLRRNPFDFNEISYDEKSDEIKCESKPNPSPKIMNTDISQEEKAEMRQKGTEDEFPTQHKTNKLLKYLSKSFDFNSHNIDIQEHPNKKKDKHKLKEDPGHFVSYLRNSDTL